MHFPLLPLLILLYAAVSTRIRIIAVTAAKGDPANTSKNPALVPRTNILLVAEPRSASSLGVEILLARDDVFGYHEPFYNFLTPVATASTPTNTLARVSKTEKEIPGLLNGKEEKREMELSSLFDCSALRDLQATRMIFWREACKRRTAAWMPPDMKSRCVRDVLTENDRNNIYLRCKASSSRVVKTVRMTPDLTRQATDDPLLKVILITRRPMEVAESWYRKGWKGKDKAAIAKHICETTKERMNAFEHLSAVGKCTRISTEEILSNPLKSAGKVFDFLGEALTNETTKILLSRLTESAAFHAKKEKASTNSEDRIARARALGYFEAFFTLSCPEVLSSSNYTGALDLDPFEWQRVFLNLTLPVSTRSTKRHL